MTQKQYTFTIKLDKDISWAKKEMGKFNYVIFKQKQKLVTTPIYTAIKTVFSKKYNVKSEKEKVLMWITGTKEECEAEKEELDDFLYSDKKKMEENSTVKQVLNDRVWHTIKRKFYGIINKMQGSGLKALGQKNVLGLMNSFGLQINNEVKPLKDEKNKGG